MTDRSRPGTGSRMEPDSRFFRPQLSDEQWAMVSDLFKPPKQSPQGGRPRADSRACLEGVLWVLRSGARWKDLPRCFPSYPTCWRRFVEWTTDGTLDRVHRRLVRLLVNAGQIDWEEGFPDGTFASAKRGDRIGPTRRGKGTKVMVLADGNGLPLASEVEAANHAEVNLIEPLIDAAVTRGVAPRLVYDQAADSDPLRERLAQRGIDLVCPHRKGRVRKPTQDGRRLRRYRKRWKIERTIA